MNNKPVSQGKNNAACCITINSQEPGKSKLRHAFNPDRKYRGVRSVAASGDSRYLVITFEYGNPRIRVLDLEKLEFLPHGYNGHIESVRLTAITRNNREFFTASWDGSSRRYEIETGRCTQIFSGFGRSPSCFLDPDGRYLFTASYDSDINIGMKNAGRCWNITTGKSVKLYKHTQERIYPGAIDIAYEKGMVFTGSDDGFAYRWNLRQSKPVLTYFSCRGSIRKVAVSGNYFAAACTDGLVRLHFKISGELFRHFRHNTMDVRDVKISKDEKKIWTADESGLVYCFSINSGELIYILKVHQLWIWSICLMQNEEILVTGSGDGTVLFLSADSGEILAELHNLRESTDFLITCPPDKSFPEGIFFTNNTDLIQVFREDEEKQTHEVLDLNDTRREAYINRMNLKNLIITRLKNTGQYTSLTEQFLRDQKTLDQISKQKQPYMLKA